MPEDKKEAVDLVEVYKLLKERLPNYMIPQYVEFLDEIPTLPSGKADRKNLPLPKDCIRAPRSEIEVEPRTELEAKIAEVWKRFLKLILSRLRIIFLTTWGALTFCSSNSFFA